MSEISGMQGHDVEVTAADKELCESRSILISVDGNSSRASGDDSSSLEPNQDLGSAESSVDTTENNDSSAEFRKRMRTDDCDTVFTLPKRRRSEDCENNNPLPATNGTCECESGVGKRRVRGFPFGSFVDPMNHTETGDLEKEAKISEAPALPDVSPFKVPPLVDYKSDDVCRRICQNIDPVKATSIHLKYVSMFFLGGNVLSGPCSLSSTSCSDARQSKADYSNGLSSKTNTVHNTSSRDNAASGSSLLTIRQCSSSTSAILELNRGVSSQESASTWGQTSIRYVQRYLTIPSIPPQTASAFELSVTLLRILRTLILSGFLMAVTYLILSVRRRR